MRWTEEQDDVLRECSFRGAEYAAREIDRRCGAAHSAHAVETRASRMHCSLAIQTVCPQCGAVGLAINRQTKMCPRCTEAYHVEQELAFQEMLEAERDEAMAEAGELRRERDALRRQNSRLKRKHRLKSEKRHALPDLLQVEY